MKVKIIEWSINKERRLEENKSYIKSEELLVAMVTETAWVREMFMTHAQLVINMAEMMLKRGFKFDAAWLFNNMK